MQKAALIFNPDSGSGSLRRKHQVELVLAQLRNAGVELELLLPHSASEAQNLTRRAIDTGCDAVIACGGDGTIHNVAQVLTKSKTALGIIPMGTANALAHDLGFPMNITKAANALLTSLPRRVAIGHLKFIDLAGNPNSRFFVVAAGCGVDAHLFYKLNSGIKNRMGMAAYYAKAWHLWFAHPMVRFAIEFSENESTALGRAGPAGSRTDLNKQHEDVTELLAVRIRNFGGVLQELAPGASLDRNDMRIVYCRTSSRFAYLRYVTRGFLRRNWRVGGIRLAYADRVNCRYSQASSAVVAGEELQPKVYVEADGELVGTLPVEITVVPDALTLLAPQRH